MLFLFFLFLISSDLVSIDIGSQFLSNRAKPALSLLDTERVQSTI